MTVGATLVVARPPGGFGPQGGRPQGPPLQRDSFAPSRARQPTGRPLPTCVPNRLWRGPEGRQSVAHGASRGVEGHPTASFSPGGATERSAPGLSPLPGLGRLVAHGVPQLGTCELIHEQTGRLHAKSQSTQRPQSKERTSPLRFFAPLRLCVSCFDFFTRSRAVGHILPPLCGSYGPADLRFTLIAFHPRLLNWLTSGGHPTARAEASPSGEHELPA